MKYKRLLVTGGAGFIGSAFIRYSLQHVSHVQLIINLDCLTYAANLKNLSLVEQDARYRFVQGNICDQQLVARLCEEYQIEAIVHFAAETHVDRSIADPAPFYETNVLGTVALCQVLRAHSHIHLHHISTDEVYGSLGEEGKFTETSAYLPNSPYAASKAASDHVVRSFAHTYGLSTTLSHCTNNYGPGQHNEKFIPQMIYNCCFKKPFPVYGQGKNIRDWIFVDDHSSAIWAILEKGKAGEVYDIGGGSEWRNIDLLHLIIQEFRKMKETPDLSSLITFVTDRPGHDYRYAIDCRKIQTELEWQPKQSMASGLRETIAWYLLQV